jgi:hypothetical protein
MIIKLRSARERRYVQAAQGKHKLQECTTPEGELKCVNCMTHNKLNPNNSIDENHSTKNATTYTTSPEDTDKILNTNMAYYTNPSISNGAKIRCLQINLQHSKAAKGNLQNCVHQCNIDIIFDLEPYVIKNKVAGMSHHNKIITQGNNKIRAAIIIQTEFLMHYQLGSYRTRIQCW